MYNIYISNAIGWFCNAGRGKIVRNCTVGAWRWDGMVRPQLTAKHVYTLLESLLARMECGGPLELLPVDGAVERLIQYSIGIVV